jgi:hypothetical protein
MYCCCSRNARLSPESRSNALSISAALKWAQQAVAQGEVSQADDTAGTVQQRIAAAGGDVDYVEVRRGVMSRLQGAEHARGHACRGHAAEHAVMRTQGHRARYVFTQELLHCPQPCAQCMSRAMASRAVDQVSSQPYAN